MKKKVISLFLVASLCVSACSRSKSDSNPDADADSSTSVAASSTEAEPTATTSLFGEAYKYKNFSLIEEGYATPIIDQLGGTCWVSSASTAMESSYLIQHGELIDPNPTKMCEYIYAEDKTEGFFICSGAEAIEQGGWSWMIVERLANGYGEYELENSIAFEDCDRDTLKKAITTYGAVVADINDTHEELIWTYNGVTTYNNPDLCDFDHAVAVVGWDDDFPKESFVKPASSNGAWLIQNSAGTRFGDNGFYWVSYDTPLTKISSFALTDKYDHVTAYDSGNENKISTGTSTTTANVFHEAGTLRAVGTYTSEVNQHVHIKVCDSSMTTVLCEQDADFEYVGYYTIELDQPIEVTDFSIVITYSTSAPVEGEPWEIEDYVQYKVSSEAGCSFVEINGEWVDLTASDIQTRLGIDFDPNNCCIKAIF